MLFGQVSEEQRHKRNGMQIEMCLNHRRDAFESKMNKLSAVYAYLYNA